MRRLLVAALLGAVMVAITALPAAASAGLTVKGTTVEDTVCEVLADESAMFEWRSGGSVCWVNHPVTVSGL